ncbi:MAG: NAD(+) synthase [Fusobacteriota bacterium]
MFEGFIRVGAAVPKLKVGNCNYNTEQIIKIIDDGLKKGVEILTFPELSITGYTCGDLFNQRILIKKAENSLEKIINHSENKNIILSIGLPVKVRNQLFNCAALIFKGKILGVVPKTHIPNYKEFYEQRWFSSSQESEINTIELCNREVPFGTDILFRDKENKDICIGVEICEDLWVPIPPSSYQALNGATILLNLSASNEVVGKSDYRRSLVGQQAARTRSSYTYVSSGQGESTTDLLFGGDAIISENGVMLNESKRFSLDNQLIYSDIDIERLINDRIKIKSYNRFDMEMDKIFRYVEFDLDKSFKKDKIAREVSSHPFIPSDHNQRDKICEEIFSIQVGGLSKRLMHTGIKKVVLGISGGLDSTLALLVCVKTFDKLGIDRKNIIGVTMPGFGTTGRTYNNAIELMKNLGITIREISIKEACLQHFKDIDHDKKIQNTTYENTQARERTQILMNLSNKEGGLVVGTGDLSELALGWATYNGDHMSMYAVNVGVPKTLVIYLVEWASQHKLNKKSKKVLLDILDTPVSPELLPPGEEGGIKHKTEEEVGPYELHDFFIYYMIRFGFSPSKIFKLACIAFDNYNEETILKWEKVFYKRFFSQQFKRSCIPDGPKVGSICFSPRGDWRMPSDASYEIWLEDLKKIKL